MADDKNPNVSSETGAELQSDEEIRAAAAAKKKLESVNTRPVRPGKYVVAGHTAVRSLDYTFQPGDDFTGADGDIRGLLKAGALVLKAADLDDE